MSYQTKAILFYGIFVRECSMSDLVGEPVMVGCAGSEGDELPYLAIRSSHYTADLDSYLKLDPSKPQKATTILRAFCKTHEIPWPDGGAAWHLVASRF